MHPRLQAAELALLEARRNSSSICEPIRAAIGVDDAAVATYGDPFGIRLVCAAGEFASAFGEMQIDLGEGPGWDAYRSRRPVLHASVTEGAKWHALAERANGMRVHSVHAFPLSSGFMDVGALCLSSHSERELDEEQLEAVARLAPLAAAAVLARAMRATGAPDDDDDDDDDRYSLREVHQATGMVTAQLRVSPDDALLAVRAHAFSTGRTVRQVAQDIVARRIDISRE